MRPTTALVILLAVGGCTVGEGAGHVESFGPKLTNECEHPLSAAVAESASLASELVRANPTTVPTGGRTTVAFDVVGGVRPAALFLAVEVEGLSLPVAELDTGDLRAGSVEYVVPAGCAALVNLATLD